MLRKVLLGIVMVGGLAFDTAAQEVIVTVRPPHAVSENRGPRPGREHIWVSGYHRWDGHRYEWVAGRWERPPRPRAHWVAHHWVKRRGGWVLVEGHWS